MTAMHLALFVAFGLFLLHTQRGREAEATRRCVACGSRYGERHNRDCHYKD